MIQNILPFLSMMIWQTEKKMRFVEYFPASTSLIKLPLKQMGL
jgi:hypothetical protein